MSMTARHLSPLSLCLLLSLFSMIGISATEDITSVQLDIQNPSWSPDGQHIAFDSTRGTTSSEIWVVHPDGTGLQRVTSNTTDEIRPAWNSDSTQLYFIRLVATTGNELWKRNLATGAETKVTQTKADDFAVSHSGTEIIVQTGLLKGVDLLVISATTGSDLRWFAASHGGESDPSWAPNDQMAVFIKGRNLWVRNTSDRSGTSQLTTYTSDSRLLSRPNWGSTGYIAFGLNGSIYKIKADGTELASLFSDSDTDAWAETPCWSPSSSRIVFCRVTGDVSDLWLMNADGSGLSRLTTPSMFAANPAGAQSALVATASGQNQHHGVPTGGNRRKTATAWVGAGIGAALLGKVLFVTGRTTKA